MIDITKEYLIKWINELANEQKIYRFYQTVEWRSLRAEIMHKHHNECYKCRQYGKITKADTVHHVYHLRDYPEYGLSEEIYIDAKKIINLIPLCNSCHNIEHPEKFNRYKNKKNNGNSIKNKKNINIEKW